jgi:hypothetical protein
MFSRLPVWLILAALVAAAPVCAEEQNVWPLAVTQLGPDGSPVSGQCVGPLFYSRQTAAGTQEGFRPLYLRIQTDSRELNYFLYPLFNWESRPGFREFSFTKLITRHSYPKSDAPEEQGFDFWPLYFSRETGDPATTYHAFFPIAGTIKQRFSRERLTWYVFPLYFNTDKAGREVTSVAWPFLRFIDGAGHHGFEFWPLMGYRGRENDYDKRFWLWPLFYREKTHLSDPTPTVRIGALPFYTSDTGPGFRSENYVWPFFGYTHRTEPRRYDEQRYLWPFFVQGQGEDRSVNRWAPLYTHSVIKGYDKTWLAWPLYRHARWDEGTVAQEKNQVLYILYWSLTQRSLTNPAAAPAYKRHLWPLASWWDNGAGRRQVQFLSPLEVFFPFNEPIRQLYSPFFSIYRYDRQGAQAYRHSLLWDAITYRRSATGREFHLGPLFSVKSEPESRRIALLGGVLGWQRRPGEGRGKFFLFDFSRKTATKASAVPSS